MRIREFAEKAAWAGGCQMVCGAPSELEQRGYSRAKRMVLDASRMEALGWRPEKTPCKAIEETVRILRECEAEG